MFNQGLYGSGGGQGMNLSMLMQMLGGMQRPQQSQGQDPFAMLRNAKNQGPGGFNPGSGISPQQMVMLNMGQRPPQQAPQMSPFNMGGQQGGMPPQIQQLFQQLSMMGRGPSSNGPMEYLNGNAGMNNPQIQHQIERSPFGQPPQQASGSFQSFSPMAQQQQPQQQMPQMTQPRPQMQQPQGFRGVTQAPPGYHEMLDARRNAGQ
jgi:hypothetical protein